MARSRENSQFLCFNQERVSSVALMVSIGK